MEAEKLKTLKVDEPSERDEISLHEYYAITGLVRRVGQRATHFIQIPRRVLDRISKLLD